MIVSVQKQGLRGSGTSGQLASFTGTNSVSGIPATTQYVAASPNKQYVTNNQLSGLVNSVNPITATNPVSDKKYTDDSISGVTFWSRSSNTIYPKYAGDNVNLLSGGIKDNNSSGVIFLDDAINTYPSTHNKTIIGGINELKNITNITKDPSGFVDPSAVTVSYDSTTRKITLTGSFEFYYNGVNVVQIDPTFVSGWVSSAHTDATDFVYYLYFNGTSFGWSNSFPGFYYPLVAIAVYRSNAKFASRECHSFMPWQVHEELHKTIGTYKDSGGTLSNYTLSSTTANNRRPYISECIIRDEDCVTTNAALTSSYSLRYLSSTNTINFTLDSTDILPLSGNNPYYNNYNGSIWQQTLMPSNSVASVWIFALPATADSASQKYRFFFEQPQWISRAQNSSPSALASAITAELSYNIGNLSIGDPSALASEYIGIARVIIQYTGGNWTIENVSYLTGSKYVQSTSTGSFLTSVTTDPTNLTGNGTASYPLNTIQNIAPSSSPTFAGIMISGAVTAGSLKVDSLSGVVTASGGNISASPLSTVLAPVSGLPNGLATLNASGVLSASQVPVSLQGGGTVNPQSTSNTIGHLVTYYNVSGTIIADSGVFPKQTIVQSSFGGDTWSTISADTDAYLSLTGNQALNITAGASSAGLELYVYNTSSSDYALTITYVTGKTVVLTRQAFVSFKWNGSQWVVKKRSIIGKTAQVDYGDFSATPYAYENMVLRRGQLLNRADYPALWHYVNTYLSPTTDTLWLAGAVGDYSTGDTTTTFRMPDDNGTFIRNAGTNGTLKMTDTVSYYSGGMNRSIRKDVMMGHKHPLYSDTSYHATPVAGSASLYVPNNGNTFSEVVTTNVIGNPKSDGTHGTPNSGYETAPVSVSRYSITYFED